MTPISIPIPITITIPIPMTKDDKVEEVEYDDKDVGTCAFVSVKRWFDRQVSLCGVTTYFL